MNVAGLLAAWDRVLPPQSTVELSASEFPGSEDVWLALDHQRLRHLLLRIPDGAELTGIATHGLRASVRRHRVEGRGEATYVDLVCLDNVVADTFGSVALDLALEVSAVEIAHRAALIATTLNRWKWFWAVDPNSMSNADAVGLFGELWFLARWAGGDGSSVSAWNASDGSRHDFQWPDHSVEVKTTAAGGSIVHSIGDLDQLDDAETGQLYLFSLRITPDVLARNSLATLTASVTETLRTEPARQDDFRRKLSARGFTPANRDVSERSYRIVDERLYIVRGGFPRLTRRSFPAGLPAGIDSVSYKLEMSACADWMCATSPRQWGPDTRVGN